MKLLYIRRKRYYVEHLIFGFHFHAFAFIILGIIALAYFEIPEWLLGILIFTIFAYLFLAMKRFYQQGIFKTFVKFCAVILGYLFAAIFGIVVVFLVSLFLF
jgi:ABC-type multidrug transport system permease subunit